MQHENNQVHIVILAACARFVHKVSAEHSLMICRVNCGSMRPHEDTLFYL